MSNFSTKSLLLGLAITSTFIGASSVQAAPPIVIDEFLTEQAVFFEPFPPVLPDFLQVEAPEAIGGFRDLQVTGDGGLATTRGSVGGEVLSFSNSAGVAGSLIATYDGDDDSPIVNPIGLGGVDLTGGVADHLLDQITVSLTAFDLDGLEVTLNLFSGTGNGTVTQTFIPNTDELNFAFSDVGFASVDFTDIGAIQLILTGPANIDASIDLFAATSTKDIPEPAVSFLLFGTAIAGGFSLRRKA